MNCRHCSTHLHRVFLDLGSAPPSNRYLASADLARPEAWYPLKLFVCEQCWLVQTEDYNAANELFDEEYAYFSSTSRSWLEHAARYCEAIIARLGLGPHSQVIEVASNDGYLLKNFVQAGIPCLGIEPTASTAAAAERLGIPVLRHFFGEALGRELAQQGRQADLIIGNNVYAHVPDINDFTRGLKAALRPGGTVTLEFPHLMRLLEEAQFDTVYHEHYSYLSLRAVSSVFEAAGLRVCDVEELPTHGGSLRVHGCHAEDSRPRSAAVAALLAEEARQGLFEIGTYVAFQARAERVKDDFVAFLIEQKRAGRTVAAYGAAAKGNTLLNFGGVRPDLLPFVYDAAASKQGKFMPGSRIPILPPAALRGRRPDYLVILPWNIAAEVRQQCADLAALGTRFVTAVPTLEIA
ncbi:MAG TPA: class I SAM-dependent methyltransferase [Ramlibacter sp.]|nr:class I SAM-dependent methyltransferase [Ramlibacter sp.]